MNSQRLRALLLQPTLVALQLNGSIANFLEAILQTMDRRLPGLGADSVVRTRREVVRASRV